MSDIWIPKDFRDIVDDYSDAKHEPKPHGIIFQNGVEVATTMQCCHCGAHFVSRKGSGIQRGFCMKHMQIECGRPECFECKPGPQDEF